MILYTVAVVEKYELNFFTEFVRSIAAFRRRDYDDAPIRYGRFERIVNLRCQVVDDNCRVSYSRDRVTLR